MAGKEGDVALEITPQVLLKAYACGIFPMSESADDPGLFWIEPERRGVIDLDAFHVPRSLRKILRSEIYEVRIDTDFQGVIDGCARPAPGRKKTWINNEIRRLYGALFEMGYCHSVETWFDGELIGGLYGVSLGGVFFGESMFAARRDASKVALVHLVARLIAGGFKMLDTQFVTDHLARFGAVEIPKATYNIELQQALQHEGDFLALPDALSGKDALGVLGLAD